MEKLLRTAAQEMAQRGEAATTRPLLTDALGMRSLTLLRTEEGLLAVAMEGGQPPVFAFSGQMRELLTNIFSALPVLYAHIDEGDSQYTEAIQTNAYQLLRMASNLEYANRLEQQRFALAPLDLSQLVDSICTSAKMLGAGRSVPIAWQVPTEPLVVKADPQLLSTAILNLLRNSLAYTRDGNNILVKLERAGKKAVLTVEDKGLGIRAESIDRVFEPYYSADPYSDSPQRPGVGLGLAVVRGAVNSFGGAVNIESRFGEGTRVHLALPLAGDAEEVLQGEGTDYASNRFSPVYVQLCGFCYPPRP